MSFCLFQDYGRANGKNHYTGKGPVIGSDYNQSLVNSLREPAIQTHQTQKVKKKKINRRLGLESATRRLLFPGEGRRLLSSQYPLHTAHASQWTQEPRGGGQTHPGNHRKSACSLPRSLHTNSGLRDLPISPAHSLLFQARKQAERRGGFSEVSAGQPSGTQVSDHSTVPTVATCLTPLW